LAKKKVGRFPAPIKKNWIDREDEQFALEKQCELLSIARSTYYYEPIPETPFNLKLMREIDKIYTEVPYYGSRKVMNELVLKGYPVNRKRIQRLMRLMGLEVIYQRPNLSKPNLDHRTFPYLLKGTKISAVNQVWSSDITYIPLNNGFCYLTAIIDWYSRYVLSWRLSKSMESGFCVDALEEALLIAKPLIFNTDQGGQFTCNSFINVLERNQIRISMDGKGRYLDNIFCERLWRSVKYEEVYINSYENYDEAYNGIESYFNFYDNKRSHQALNYKVPKDVYFGAPLILSDQMHSNICGTNDFALDV
jgi:putative transposase